MATQAGDRVLNRKTKATHTQTGIVLEIDNSNIPTGSRPKSHRQQMDEILGMMCDRLGNGNGEEDRKALRKQCIFDFSVENFEFPVENVPGTQSMPDMPDIPED